MWCGVGREEGRGKGEGGRGKGEGGRGKGEGGRGKGERVMDGWMDG